MSFLGVQAMALQAVWKHKSCWTPALDFHREQMPGHGPGARWCLLCEAPSSPRLSSSATPTRRNLASALPHPALDVGAVFVPSQAGFQSKE